MALLKETEYILREETWTSGVAQIFNGLFLPGKNYIRHESCRRPFNASGGVTALLLNNPNNNLENFDKCPVACGYATKVSKVTHSPSIAVKGKCQSRVNTLMHNEISDHLFFAGKQERYARGQNTLLESNFSSKNSISHCLKITQNVAFEFLDFGIFHQFLNY